MQRPSGGGEDPANAEQRSQDHEWLASCKAKVEATSPSALLVAHHTMQRGYQHRASPDAALQLELAANQQLLMRADFAHGVACVVGARGGEAHLPLRAQIGARVRSS